MVLSILNGFFCLAFAGFAYVNLNDGDSWLWVVGGAVFILLLVALLRGGKKD